MKILSVMWSAVLFNLQPEQEYKTSAEIYEITKEAQLYKYEYLTKEHPYSDIIWDVANDLKEINLEENPKLRDVFFKYWKKVEYSSKLRIFKNVDMPEGEKFNAQIKDYYIKNFINYPTIMELFKFRTSISQEDLKQSLHNLIKNINFNDLKNQIKKDYWENHISGKEADKLLDLLELSGMKGEELKEFNTVGFLNETRQAKFDKINEQESNLPLIKNESTQVYLLTTKINAIILLKEEKKLGTVMINCASQYMIALMTNAIGNKNIQVITTNNPLKFIIEDKEIYENAVIRSNSVTKWLENNQSLLIEKVKDFNKQNKTFADLEEETKELAEKIILKANLENKLTDKNIKLKTTKKI